MMKESPTNSKIGMQLALEENDSKKQSEIIDKGISQVNMTHEEIDFLQKQIMIE